MSAITLICQKFLKRGGIERYLLALVNGLHRRGITPNVCSLTFDKRIPEYQYIHPVRFALWFVPKQYAMRVFSFFLRKKRHNLGVMISTTHTFCDIAICGGNHKGYINAIKKIPSAKDKLKMRQEHRVYHEAKLIIAHSELMKKELISFYQLPSDKVHVIYPPIDEQEFYVREEQERLLLREKYGFSGDKVYFLFPSTGHERKGLGVLATYFHESNLPIELVVVGSPLNKEYAQYRNIRALGFSNQMSELYAAADFTIMASIYEPFGLVAIESILCGTPVVMSSNMACTEVIDEQGGLMFERDSVSSLDNAIKLAVARVGEKKARVAVPLQSLRYDPSLDKHIEAVLEKVQSV